MLKTKTAKELGVSAPYRAPRHGLCARRRARQPPARAHRPARQARGLFRRQVAHHRLRAVERAQLRHSPHRGRHPIQGPQPHPPPAARLELLPAGAQRELRRPARLAARLRDDVVSRDGRRGLSEHRHHRELSSPIHGAARRRSHLQDGLRKDAAAARRHGRRRDRRLSRGLARGSQRLRRHACRRKEQRSSVPREAEEPAADAGQAGRRPVQHGHLRVRDLVPDRPSQARRGRRRIRATISARTSFPTSSRTAKRSRITSRSPA